MRPLTKARRSQTSIATPQLRVRSRRTETRLTVIAGVRVVAAVREAAAEAEVAVPADFFEAVLCETAATVRAVAVILARERQS